jgi:hypothetical protein
MRQKVERDPLAAVAGGNRLRDHFDVGAKIESDRRPTPSF